MEPLIEKLITLGSPMGVLVVVVWFFLKHLDSRDARNEAMLTHLYNNFQEAARTMHGEHIAVRQETRSAIEKNERATEMNTQALRDLAISLRGLDSRLGHKP